MVNNAAHNFHFLSVTIGLRNLSRELTLIYSGNVQETNAGGGWRWSVIGIVEAI